MSRKSKQTFLANVKGPLNGRCNICGTEGQLTADHIPPKSCGGVTAAYVQELHAKLSDGSIIPPRGRPQSRVTVRSLCARCNHLLGHNYDPALADFCRQARTIADGVLRLPDEVRVDIRPTAVM